MNDSIIYKRIQLFLSSGILVGIWGNLFIQSRNIKYDDSNKKLNVKNIM